MTTSPITKSSSPPERPSAAPVTYPAELYAAVHRGQPGDVGFYGRFCAGAREVLELGCGFGRIARPLSDDGLQVTGVDLSESLLELARRRAPRATLVEADFRELSLGQSFDRIVCPFNGLYCMTSQEDLVRTLRAVRDHLRPEGLFAFDVYDADDFHADDSASEDLPGLVASCEALGTCWDVFERSRWDRSRQRIDAVYTHVPHDGRARVEAVIPQRYLISTQVEPLLAEAGLTLLGLYGDFDERPHDRGDGHLLVCTARLAAAA